MTILESLASARPTIATRVGAVGKLIVNGETGILVEARDVENLSDAMMRCLRDASFASQLGRRGEAHVRSSFSAENMARQYLTTYESACAGRELCGTTSYQEV